VEKGERFPKKKYYRDKILRRRPSRRSGGDFFWETVGQPEWNGGAVVRTPEQFKKFAAWCANEAFNN